MRRLSSLLLFVPLACLVLVSCSTSGTSGQAMHPIQPIRPGKPTPPPPPKVYAFSRGNLNFLGLEQVWERGLNDKDAPTVRDAYLLGDFVVIETNTLKLYGLNRKSGQPEFVVTLDSPTDVRCAEDEHNVYAVANNILYAIDKRAFVAYRKYLDFPPSSQMVADENNLYMGCYDGKVRAFRTSMRYVDWQWSTQRIVTSRPVMGTRLIYAGSEDGTLYALSPDNGSAQWKFKTLDAIRGNVAYSSAEHQVYVASTDTNLYGLKDQPQGSREAQMAWPMPYPTGAAIVKGPIIGGGTVYVINENRECHAVEAKSGRAQWVLKDVSGFVSRGDHNTYLLRANRYILAVDNTTGDVHWILDTTPLGVSRILQNSTDGSIYLMRDDGSTIFVRERHPQALPEVKPAEGAKPAEGGAAKPAAPAAAQPAEGAAPAAPAAP